ncbi:hypothetical protein GAR05_02531 [Micromonospora saelicesensis]|uniref:Uncharacterized protein n=1 Tax=Micromonospora saelicesensis TaxID=285676 RepID=A0ABX9CKA1_9ACTN|nr:hypothetical protein GAR05_02531 [Micromonospora saelicesensis]
MERRATTRTTMVASGRFAASHLGELTQQGPGGGEVCWYALTNGTRMVVPDSAANLAVYPPPSTSLAALLTAL